MNGGLSSYKFGQKNNWRRRVWNHIRDNAKSPRLCVGLYLPAEEDLDYAVAVSKGFDPRNLIAVDRDASVVHSLRSKGRLVIYGELLDILRSWPVHRVPLGFIHCDLFSNYSPSAVSIAHAAMESLCLSGGGTLVINLLRGRENSCAGQILKRLGAENGEAVHRAIPITTAMGAAWAGVTVSNLFQEGTQIWKSQASAADRVVDILQRRRLMFSYKSNGQVFDSAVFNLPPVQGQRRRATDETRQIAAILAHRTMRLRA